MNKTKIEAERDTYRDLCGELLSQLIELREVSCVTSKEITTVRGDFVDWMESACELITKAEAIMGENSNE